MNKIKVIDAIMGKGKTQFCIQKMNEDTENNYIYITPFLSEVQRIKDNCSGRKFSEPTNIGNGKLDSLHNLLKDGKNIASTHALFQKSNEITKDLIQANNYILMLDEVCDVIEQIPLKKNDMDSILEFAHIEDDLLIWDKEDYDGRYNDIKQSAFNKTIMVVNNCLLMWNFPVEVFTAFKECYIMTYIFDAQIQKYYYDMHGVEYEYYSVTKEDGKYKLIPHENIQEDKSQLREKIHVLENDIINNVGEKEFSLSATWFERECNKPLLQILRKNIYNYFQQKVHAKSKEILWTTYKSSQNKLAGKGYAKSFLAMNARATNEYRDRIYLAYCVNVFLNPIVKQFFDSKGVSVMQDQYALSEELQWIWRSAIRTGKDIYCYIPSERMRNLLLNWLQN